MEPWIVGLIALIVVGLGVIIYGALHDRARNRRRAAAMLAPPPRAIPHFRPDSPAPHYLSELQARRAPPDAEPTDLTPSEREVISAQLADPATVTIRAGYASRDFATDRSSGWAVLESPRVLVCADPVTSMRELLTVLEKLIISRTPVVLVAPAIADEVRTTLEVNRIRQLIQVVAVSAPETDLRTIVAATHARLIDRADRQAGYVDLHRLGRCARWISTPTASHIVVAADLEQSR
jgi:hypothetical protein